MVKFWYFINLPDVLSLQVCVLRLRWTDALEFAQTLSSETPRKHGQSPWTARPGNRCACRRNHRTVRDIATHGKRRHGLRGGRFDVESAWGDGAAGYEKASERRWVCAGVSEHTQRCSRFVKTTTLAVAVGWTGHSLTTVIRRSVFKPHPIHDARTNAIDDLGVCQLVCLSRGFDTVT